MRRLSVALVMSLMIATNAMAMGEGEPSTLEKVKSAVGMSTPKPFSEPNLKFPKDSGGPVTSKLVTDAPLPEDFSMGKKTAQINMIEYVSMSCPHCAHFSTSVMPEIQKKYIATGKIRYILRQFPLNEPALKGAMLLTCLGERDESKYYVFAKALFDAQNKWAFDTNFLANLETIAAVGGVSKEDFASCTGPTEKESVILKAQKQAKEELKIPHTPYIIIGNEIFTGDRTVEAVSAFIDKKLAELPKPDAKKAAE